MSAPDVKPLVIHLSTVRALSEVERIFLDRFVQDGRAIVVKDTLVVV
jgi:hypothetical protein